MDLPHFFEVQLEFIQYLQKLRTPFLDTAIKFLDHFDRQEFMFVLLPLLFLGLSWKWGLRIFYLLALNHVVNFALKNFFELPRPFHLDPALGIIQVEGYGFPSGGAETAILLSGVLVLHWKNKYKWLVAIGYTLLISFSRLYLGVHFPIDIVGGWIVGLLLLGVYYFLFPLWEGFFVKRSPSQSFLITLCLLLGLMFLSPSAKILSMGATALGLHLGVFTRRFVQLSQPIPKKKIIFYISGLVAVVGLFAIYHFFENVFVLQPIIHEIVTFFLIGFWMSFVALYLCDRLYKYLLQFAQK